MNQRRLYYDLRDFFIKEYKKFNNEYSMERLVKQGENLFDVIDEAFEKADFKLFIQTSDHPSQALNTVINTIKTRVKP